MKRFLLLFLFLLVSCFGFAQADIKVLNTNFQTKYVPGSEVVYTISVINLGPATANNVNVSSLISNGVSQKAWTGPANVDIITGAIVNSGGSGEINHDIGILTTNQTIGTLNSGQMVSYIMTITVPLGFTGNLNCKVTATSTTIDSDPANNVVTDTDTKGIDADISVTNTNNQLIYTPGTTTTYTVKVKNNGPLNAGGVVVTNTMPAGITSYSWTGDNGSAGTNVPLNNSIGTLVAGKTITYTITAQIPAGFLGNLINTVSASSPTMDNTPANNTAIDKDVVANSGANLVVVNTDGVTTYSPGTQKVYTVTVTNNGPLAASNVLVTNAIPVGITSFSWTGSNGSSGTNVPLNNTVPTLANGASVTYTITLNIPITFLGNLVSEASATSTTPDYYPECPQCIDTDTLKNETDIMVTNTNNQLSYSPGGTSVYTVTVKNNGPKFATNVVVNNPIPASITSFSWAGNAANGTNVPLNNTILSLAPGQSMVYTITLQVPAAFTGNLTTVATATSSVPDGNTLNNTASDTDTLGQQADVAITTTNNQAVYVPGGTSTYTITVTNNGPLNATNVLVENAIPAGVVTSSWSGNGATGANVNLSNTIVNLQSGQSVVYTLVLQIPSALTGNLVSTATATTAVPDTNTLNNTASDTDTLATDADIQITTTNNQISYTPGGTAVYTVTVLNNGPLNATNVLVTSAIPAGITSFSWTGNGATGTNVSLNNTILTLASGASVVYTITMQIPAAFTGNLTSTATANAAEADANSSNNSATDTDTLGLAADVVITTTDNQTSYLPGGTTTYTITVTNNGPLNATAILVENAIPAGIVSSSWSGNGATGTNVSISNTIANLQPGQSVVYTMILQIPAAFTGNLVSTATATSSVIDNNTLNNTATDTDTLATEADVQITHTNNQVSYIPGGTSVYTVTVSNNGLLGATNVLVNSAIPSGITSFSWTGNGANSTNANLNNTILSLASGASVVYTITMQIPLTLTGNLVSTATATSAVPDSNTVNNTATDTDTLGIGADIVVSNTNNQVVYIPGTTSVYTITVTNNGPLNAVNVVVTNPLPAGIITSAWTGTNGSSGANTGLVNTIPLLPVGSTIAYTFTINIPVGFNADIISVAGVTSDTADPNPTCAACLDKDILLLPLADLVTTITDNSATYRAGDPRIYTITITNNGPSSAQNVVVQGNVSSGVPSSNISWYGNGAGVTAGYLNTTIPTLANGATVTYYVNVPVPSNYSQTENLIANVSVTSDATDPNPGCTNCIDIDTPNPNADLVVYKTNNQTKFLLNEPTVYTITVRNDGASDAINVVVNDALPPGIPAENMSWVSSIGTSGSGALNDLIPSVANGEIIIYQVTVQVPQFLSSITGNLVNTVNVTSGTSEFNINNNNSSDVDGPRPFFVTVDSQSYSTVINNVSGPERLIKNILINEPCVQLSNFSASAPISFGYFHRNNSDFAFKEGIIIRSGIAKNTEGKYSGNGTTSTGSGIGDADLNAILAAAGLSTNTQDASYVKFDFVPTVEEFSFNFLFASQEYGGFQCPPPNGGYVDAFAFILTNLNTGQVQNLAVVPGTTTLVAVPTIRKQIYQTGCADQNPNYFDKYNASTAPGVGPVSQANVDASAINLKGQTKSMVASATVVPNTPYRIKLVISDIGDKSLDSAVFLEAGSFNIGGPKITGTGVYASNEDFSGSSAFCAGTPRIIRAGTAPNPNVVYSWRKDDVLLVGETSYELEVSESGIYTVVFTYINSDPNAVPCQQTDDIVVEFNPTDFPMDEANDLYACNDATPTFNLKANEPTVMAAYDQSDFDTYYYTSLAAAQDPLGVPIPTAQLTTYAGVDGQQIWMKMVNVFSGGNCDPVETFKLFFTTAPSGTLSYAEDGGEPGFCSGSSSILPAVAPDLTVGGTYSALPSGLTINPTTGAIDLSTSLVGTYTVTYEFSGQGCDPFTVSTQVEVIFCGATVASNSGNVCEGAATFNLFATDAGAGSTYEWSDYNGVPFSTDQFPVGVAVPTTAGDYIYTVVATINGVPTPPSSTTLTVHPIPTAAFSAVSPICTNTAGTITFTGTPGAIVNFTDGTNNYSTTIDATGNGVFITPNLPVDTTFTLVDVTGATTPACVGTLTGSLIIAVGLPTASIIGFTNPVICSGTATGLEIQGTPNSTVSYTKDGVAQTVVTLSSTGTATIDTGIQTVTTTTTYIYVLTNVVSDSTPSCSDTITGQTATLTVNALPTATIATSTTAVCEGTAATLNFTGTPNATVTYTDGTQNLTTTLNGAGISTVTTAALSTATTFSLVSAEVTNTVLCSQTITGSVTISINNNTAIATQPSGGTICVNGTITFTVGATGSGLTYQWRLNGAPIPAATSASYTIASAVATDAGNYSVVVTGSCGPAVTSANATLILTQETIIQTQPQASIAVCVGQPISLSVAATGTNFTYQWYKGTNALAGQTFSTLNIASVTTADAGTYSVVLTNSCQVVTSTNAVVIVNELPAITTQPIGTTICEGQGINLSVSATGTNLTYQWYRGATAIAAATASTYSDASVSLAEAGNYTVIVSGICAPPVTSSVAVINVNQTATFTQQPAANTIVCVGGSISLMVTTTGGTGVSYQWFKGASPIAGATSTTYTIASSVVADAGSYTCVVTVASCGTITSNVANVVVNQLPAITTQPIGTTICEFQGINLSVAATGTNLTYQWYRGATAIPGATASTYSDASVSLAEAGNYTVIVSGACTPAVTSSVAVINVNQTATFTQQPAANTIVCVGGSISLMVATTGGTGVSYQWFKGASLIAGATSTTYTIASSVVADAGSYTCVVTVASCGTITSNVATVVVNELPAITTQPIGATICELQGINLSVTAIGTGISYQWFLNGGVLAGATSATYTDASVTLAEAGNYTVTVTGICTPAVTSQPALIVVNQAPTFIQPPTDQTVCSGQPVTTLTVATTGGTNVTYQWFKGATAIAGATAASYPIAAAVVADSGNYTCQVTSDSCGTITSAVAVIVVNQGPAIISLTGPQEICVGQTATYTVLASGTNLMYQWYKGTTPIIGATASTYIVANATQADSGAYKVVISSTSCPDIESTPINLVVKPLPIATIAQGTPSAICAGQSTQVLFSGTPGAVVIYTINGGTPETLTLNPAGGATVLPTGSLSTTTVYELVSVTYTGPNACSQNLTGSATVTVTPLPVVNLEDGYICIDPVTLATTRTYTLNTGLNQAQYTFEWFDVNGSIPSETKSFYEATVVGQYGVTITDIISGCQASAFANVDESKPPTDFTYTVSGFFADNPTVVITATPIGTYEYQLDFGPFQESNVFDNIEAGTHTITVRDPEVCDVLQKEVLIIDYPKYFTPNGDGINDTWNIPSIKSISNTKIFIFDRFGKLIKQMTTSDLGWDGTYNGQALPATDYWFTINYEEAGISKEFRAHFSLKR